MTDEVAEPAQQFSLADIGLPRLPVEPEHKGLRRPALDIGVERKLFVLGSVLVAYTVAVEVDLEGARRLPNGKFGLCKFRRVIEQRPVMAFHEQVRIGEFQFALYLRHQARHLEGLAPLGGSLQFHSIAAVPSYGIGEAAPLGFRQFFDDLVFELLADIAGYGNFGLPVLCLADGHSLGFP